MMEPDQQYVYALRIAIVTGVFSLVVGGLLLVDYQGRIAEDPLNTPAFIALKESLQENPQDEAARDELRALDQQLREAYFHRRRFTKVGTWMLVVGVGLTLAAGVWAISVRYTLPHPHAREDTANAELEAVRFSRWAVAAVGAFVVIASLLWIKASPETVPAEAVPADTGPSGDRQLAAAPTVPRTAPADSSPPAKPPVPAKPTADGPDANAKPATDPQDPASSKTVTPPPAETPKEATTTTPEPADPPPNWPRFRGPGGLGISAVENPPTAWDIESGEGVVWKTAIPVPGNSSAIAWDQHVFLSGATEEKRVVMGFAMATGECLWQTEIPGTEESTAEVPEVSEATGFAASTPVTDGQRVYAMFANGDLGAVDFEGQLCWSLSLGIPENIYGHASSLAMVGDRVIIQLDQAGSDDGLSRLIAVDGATGKTVWETPREVPNSWPTPIVIRVDGAAQIVTAADPWVIGYAAEDGKELWRAEYLQGDVGPSPTFSDGILFVANEFPGAAAIRAGGTGNITDSHILWEADWGAPDCCTPLATDGWVLLAASYGVLTCYDAEQGGDPLWEEEMDATFVASPVMAGGNLYLFDEEGKVWITQATKDGCEQVAELTLGEGCVTTPAFMPGRLIIRGAEHLFCLGK